MMATVLSGKNLAPVTPSENNHTYQMVVEVEKLECIASQTQHNTTGSGKPELTLDYLLNKHLKVSK